MAAGIGWVEGITYEWSPASTLEAVKMLLDLGLDVNAQADTGRTALHGAAHKGRPAVVQVLVDHGARLDVRDYGNTDNRGSGELAGSHLAARGLRRWVGPRRRAIGDPTSRNGAPHPKIDDGSRA